MFTGASSVAVTRYRYRGSNIPTPWTPSTGSRRQRLTTGARHVESPLRGDSHAGFGGRAGKPTGSNPGRAPRPDPTGRFYRTALNGLLQRINTYLVRWAKRKYKRLRTFKKVRKWWEGLTTRQPRLFAHWAWMTDSKYSL